jgi:hypothetical protein
MRTTLDIDDDVLAAVEQMAAAQNASVGSVISALARKALTRPADADEPRYHNGIRVLPRRGGEPVTNEMVQELLEPKFCLETGLWDV